MVFNGDCHFIILAGIQVETLKSRQTDGFHGVDGRATSNLANELKMC